MPEKEKKLQKEKELSTLMTREQELLDQEFDLRSDQRHLEDEEDTAEWVFGQLSHSIDEIWYTYQFDGRPADRHQAFYQERDQMRYRFEVSRDDLERSKKINREAQDDVYDRRLRLQREIEEMD